MEEEAKRLLDAAFASKLVSPISLSLLSRPLLNGQPRARELANTAQNDSMSDSSCKSEEASQLAELPSTYPAGILDRGSHFFDEGSDSETLSLPTSFGVSSIAPPPRTNANSQKVQREQVSALLHEISILRSRFDEQKEKLRYLVRNSRAEVIFVDNSLTSLC